MEAATAFVAAHVARQRLHAELTRERDIRWIRATFRPEMQRILGVEPASLPDGQQEGTSGGEPPTRDTRSDLEAALVSGYTRTTPDGGWWHRLIDRVEALYVRTIAKAAVAQLDPRYGGRASELRAHEAAQRRKDPRRFVEIDLNLARTRYPFPGAYLRRQGYSDTWIRKHGFDPYDKPN